MRIYSIVSDRQEDQEMSMNLKLNKIGQKFLYFGDGASLYYAGNLQNSRVHFSSDQYVECLLPHIQRDKVVTIISLGCGDLSTEIGIVTKLKDQNVDVQLVGVDSSLEMLQLASENLSNSNLYADLRRADITTQDFREDMKEFLKTDTQKIFTFFGSTFANVDQKMIVSMLFNLLTPGDLLWFDVYLREGTTPLDDTKFFQLLLESSNNEARREFLFSSIKAQGIDVNVGRLVLDIVKEEDVGALRSIFSFEFCEPISIARQDEIIPFRKGERILLQIYRRYDEGVLISFIESFGFTKLDFRHIDHKLGQFLFVKE